MLGEEPLRVLLCKPALSAQAARSQLPEARTHLCAERVRSVGYGPAGLGCEGRMQRVGCILMESLERGLEARLQDEAAQLERLLELRRRRPAADAATHTECRLDDADGAAAGPTLM